MHMLLFSFVIQIGNLNGGDHEKSFIIQVTLNTNMFARYLVDFFESATSY